MQNHYEILGVTKEASKEQIKVAYKKMAIFTHPDKGGDPQKFAAVNEAYNVLFDAKEREKFNQKWQVYSDENPPPPSGYLPSDGIAYSLTFRQKHDELINKFTLNPAKTKVKKYFNVFKTNIYNQEFKGYELQCSSIYELIANKEKIHPNLFADNHHFNSLNVVIAVDILIEFLNGNFYGGDVDSLKKLFANKIEHLKSLPIKNNDLLLYQGINEIISLKKNKLTNSFRLILAIQKITDYAKLIVNHPLMGVFASLFQNKYYRNLVSEAIHYYWFYNQEIYSKAYFEQLNGKKTAKKLIKTLKSKLDYQNDNDKELIEILRYLKLLAEFDKDINNDITLNSKFNSDNAAFLIREKAYLILDWLPAIGNNSSLQIIMNTYLQAAIYFQQASIVEEDAIIKMADESLALYLYGSVIKIAEDVTPDLELYAYLQCLGNITNFKYDNEIFINFIPALQHRCLIIADIFPFYQPLQSNIEFFKNDNQSILLMRNLLHNLMDIINESEKINVKANIDHQYVTVLYSVYEGSLKNWYQEKHSSDVENTIRYQLMHKLLSDKNWQFDDLEYNLYAPWKMGAKSDGWINPKECLHFPDMTKVKVFSSVEGFEINSRTKKYSFIFKSGKPGKSSYRNLLTILDVDEVISRRIKTAVFSLDPADPDKPHHPFNKIFFSPSNLYHSQFLHTLLMTDYILKFLTVGYEVQTKHPYNMRPIDNLISHLPAHLKKIIDDFHQANHSNALHRFWIEAGDISVATTDDPKNSDIKRYAFSEMKMHVKKHVMIRDTDGNLIDHGDEKEGWNFYVLTKRQMREVYKKNRKLTSPSMVFLDNSNQVYFYENGWISEEFVIDEIDDQLIKLFRFERDLNEKVIKTQNNSALIYSITLTIAKQANIFHHYSPEFIFAQEFTNHYNEFAIYFPEFGRLRELSRLTAMVKMMDNESEIIKKLNNTLYDKQYWDEVRKKIQECVINNVKQDFSNWRSQFSTSVLREKCRQVISSLKSEIKYVSSSNENAYIDQLKTIFSKQLASKSYYEQNSILQNFLYNDGSKLVNALVEYEERNSHVEIQKSFPNSSIKQIASALNGNREAINNIAEEEINRQFYKNKERLKGEINEEISQHRSLEKGFKEMGLGEQSAEIDLDNICPWVPASINHQVSDKKSHTVYGGVHINANINILLQNNPNRQLLTNQVYSQLSQVQQNRINGNAFRDQVANTLSSIVQPFGMKVETEVYKKNPIGRRFMDVECQSPNGTPLFGIETKVGKSPYTAAQQAKDAWLSSQAQPYPIFLVRKL